MEKSTFKTEFYKEPAVITYERKEEEQQKFISPAKEVKTTTYV